MKKKLQVHKLSDVKIKARPKQDVKAGLTEVKSGGRYVSKYTPDLALQICEKIAEGMTLSAICEQEGMPHRQTFNRWVVNNPDLTRAYSAARELSSYAMEEEALDLARAIRTLPEISSQLVRAYDIGMNQLRWSAMRRNPQVFSEKAAIKITVPIQINTGLDLGGTSASGGTKDYPNIYEVDAEVTEVVDDPKKTTYKEKMNERLPGEGSLVPSGKERLAQPRKRQLTPKSFEERRKRDENDQARMKKAETRKK